MSNQILIDLLSQKPNSPTKPTRIVTEESDRNLPWPPGPALYNRVIYFFSPFGSLFFFVVTRNLRVQRYQQLTLSLLRSPSHRSSNRDPIPPFFCCVLARNLSNRLGPQFLKKKGNFPFLCDVKSKSSRPKFSESAAYSRVVLLIWVRDLFVLCYLVVMDRGAMLRSGSPSSPFEIIQIFDT